MTQDQLTYYMLSRPDSVFAVFTHVGGGLRSVDFLIRIALSIRYRKPVAEMPSHCGIIWAEGEYLYYWHQTWPVFRKERWKYRQYNHFFEIENPDAVRYARAKAREMESSAVGYGVGTLVNFAWTLWCKMRRNVIRIGEVCSTALALLLPGYILPTGSSHSDIDPYKALFRLSISGIPQFIIKKE